MTPPRVELLYTCVAVIRKRYFDEIAIGETRETLGITVTQRHVMDSAAVSMDFFELHSNEGHARRTQAW